MAPQPGGTLSLLVNPSAVTPAWLSASQSSRERSPVTVASEKPNTDDSPFLGLGVGPGPSLKNGLSSCKSTFQKSRRDRQVFTYAEESPWEHRSHRWGGKEENKGGQWGRRCSPSPVRRCTVTSLTSREGTWASLVHQNERNHKQKMQGRSFRGHL